MSNHKYFNFLNLVSYIFFLYGILFIPFPFYFFSFQEAITSFIFEDFIAILLSKGWGITLENRAITSDSMSLYVLVLLLFLLATITVLGFTFIRKWNKYSESIYAIIRLICIYYLSMQLLKYGCDKLFKAQFYSPEPNILYTPLGQIDKDLLFWSSMGTSYSYNLFMGFLEICPALLLLFRKFRILGLLLAVPVLINIVAINFSFDISVKIYSIFLLSIALFLLIPYLKYIYDFLVEQKEIRLPKLTSVLKRQPQLATTLKVFFIGLIFLEVLSPYFITLNFNDDLSPRPYLHGAYQVEEVISKRDSIDKTDLDIKRIFVHRRGYLIFQNRADETQDFRLRIDTIQRQFILTDYSRQERKLDYTYNEQDSILSLQFFQSEQEYWLQTKALNWRNLPVIQDKFHWTIEGVK